MTNTLFVLLTSIAASIGGWYIPVVRQSYGGTLRRYVAASVVSTALVVALSSLL